MVVGGLVLVMLVLFLLAEAVGTEAALTDVFKRLAATPWLAAVAGVGLLVIDVLLPVPSTFVMIYLGWMFHTLGGTALSVLGCSLAALVAYAIGSRGGSALDRFLGPEDRARAHRLLERYGLMAIVITRPIPMFAEAVALLAGASGLGAWRVTLAAAAGSLPVALLHAWAGSRSAEAESLATGTVVLMFVLVLAISALFWLIGRRWQKPPSDDESYKPEP